MWQHLIFKILIFLWKFIAEIIFKFGSSLGCWHFIAVAMHLVLGICCLQFHGRAQMAYMGLSEYTKFAVRNGIKNVYLALVKCRLAVDPINVSLSTCLLWWCQTGNKSVMVLIRTQHHKCGSRTVLKYCPSFPKRKNN